MWHRWVLVLLFSGAVGAGAVWGLRALPYSTSWITSIETADTDGEPTNDRLTLGALEWDFAAYRTADSLASYRDAFRACEPLIGLDAAHCIVAELSARSPVGDPPVEFVDAQFDPAVALRLHLGGVPGHCTTRSALAATALLALGKPARIAQLLPSWGSGHNIIEVWQPGDGWVLFDPVVDDAFSGKGLLSACSLLGGSHVSWHRLTEGPDLSRYRAATVIYPEPWLYTRTGPRCASWPFRGCFARAGVARFELGPAQKLSIAVFGLSALLGFVSLTRLLVAWRAATRPRASARPTDETPMGEPQPDVRSNVG